MPEKEVLEPLPSSKKKVFQKRKCMEPFPTSKNSKRPIMKTSKALSLAVVRSAVTRFTFCLSVCPSVKLIMSSYISV